MKTTFVGALGALGLMLCAAPASAQDGDYYTFDLYNVTPWTILTFQTGQPNGTYSPDWIPTRVLEAGDNVAMRFYDSEDACDYYVKITFTDGDVWEQQLDFCNLESVVVSEDGIEGYQ